MRIQIQTETHKLCIPIPTGLVFSRFSAWIANTVGRRYAGEAMRAIPPDAVHSLFAEFRRMKRKHGSWTLVEVHSADGEHILIRL